MEGTIVIKGWIATLLLASALSGCAPVVRWRLGQTIKSLPAAPPSVTLLAREEGSASGSDCVAYYVHEIYGTNQPLDDVVRYYQQELGADRWKQLHDYIPDGPEAAAFQRGGDEFLGLLTSKYVDFDFAVRNIPFEKLAQFETVYILRVVRTCGRGLSEWPASQQSP